MSPSAPTPCQTHIEANVEAKVRQRSAQVAGILIQRAIPVPAWPEFGVPVPCWSCCAPALLSAVIRGPKGTNTKRRSWSSSVSLLMSCMSRIRCSLCNVHETNVASGGPYMPSVLSGEDTHCHCHAQAGSVAAYATCMKPMWPSGGPYMPSALSGEDTHCNKPPPKIRFEACPRTEEFHCGRVNGTCNTSSS